MSKKEMPVQIKAFLDLVKQTRLKKGLSHQQLADKANINRSTISLMESHQLVPSMSVALKVAQALDMKLSGMIKKVE